MAPVSHYVLSKGDPEAEVAEVVGGKAASLSRLLSLGFPVPPFFAVSVRAFLEMSKRDFDTPFLEELKIAYEGLGGDGARLAVRSSALGEDSLERSFAGLYHTSLDVISFDGLLDALRQCWRSFENQEAVAYRSHSPHSTPAGMGVAVQRFVAGDWSGVTFTVNPVTMALSEVLVNVIPDSGDKLVSGSVNPEEIVLRRSDGGIVHRAGISVGVPDAVVEAVWRQSVAVSAALAFPQDIEWTVADSELFLLQSRPITTISSIFYNRCLEPWKDDPATGEDPEKVWTRAFGDEVCTSPESPLNYTIRNPPEAPGGFFAWDRELHDDERELPPATAKYFKAAQYTDVEVLKGVYEYQPRVARVEGILNFFPTSMREEVRRAPWRWRGRVRRHHHLETQQKEIQSIFRNHRYLAEMWPGFIETADRWLDIDLDRLPLPDLRAHLGAVLPHMATVGRPCAIGVIYHSFDLTFLLTGFLDRWFGNGDVLYARVSSGLDDSETVAETQAIWRLAQTVRDAGPTAVEAVRAGNWRSISVRAGDPTLASFIEEFSAFLRSHRHRGASYKDVIYPRWGDDPDLLLNLVKTYLESAAVSPAAQNQRQGELRRATDRDLLRRLWAHPLKRAALRWLFRYNEIYMAIRNDHRFYFDRVWYELRRIYQALGRILVEKGVLLDRDDVFFLGALEVEAGLADQLAPYEAERRIVVRKADWHETLRSQAPKFLRGYIPFEDDEPRGLDGATLSGIAASPGVVVGRARVIYSIDELVRLEDGDVLVTRQTDPGWTPVFAKLGGLVLETGGVLAHGTSLCREYGLACVTAVEGATRRINDGATIRVDGSAGRVFITTTG